MGLDLVELALAIEEEFDISITDAKLEKIRTPMDYAIYLSETVYKNQEKEFLEILETVMEISIEQFALDAYQISPHSRYIEDLGA